MRIRLAGSRLLLRWWHCIAERAPRRGLIIRSYSFFQTSDGRNETRADRILMFDFRG
jgi:hypothetical protein